MVSVLDASFGLKSLKESMVLCLLFCFKFLHYYIVISAILHCFPNFINLRLQAGTLHNFEDSNTSPHTSSASGLPSVTSFEPAHNF